MRKLINSTYITLDDLTNDLLAIGNRGRRSGPQCWDISGQSPNRVPLVDGQQAWLPADDRMILLVQLLLGDQLLFPVALQGSCHQAVLWLNLMVLPGGTRDIIRGTFLPLPPAGHLHRGTAACIGMLEATVHSDQTVYMAPDEASRN